MKINRFNKINEEYNDGSFYYEIRNYQSNGEYYVIPGEEEYDFNYDDSDIKSVVEFYLDYKKDNYNGTLKIIKIIGIELDDSDIEKVKKELELDSNTKKYNV